jgi:DNA-binding NtrC family response regulator
MSEGSALIVAVDDEEMVVKSLSFFLELETPYQVKVYTSAKEALAFIAANDVDIVISDYLMPEMDGLRFLAGVRDLKPEVPRIILTGYADKENAIKAINEVGLYQYIEKPWNNEDLRIILRNGIEKKQLLQKLRQKMGEVTKAYEELQGIQREVLKAFV